MTPDEALAEIKKWRERDEEANAAVRAVLDRHGYNNLPDLYSQDPELLLFIHEALVPLMQMDDRFALEDALVREGRRDITGRAVELDDPNPDTRNLELPPP